MRAGEGMGGGEGVGGGEGMGGSVAGGEQQHMEGSRGRWRGAAAGGVRTAPMSSTKASAPAEKTSCPCVVSSKPGKPGGGAGGTFGWGGGIGPPSL